MPGEVLVKAGQRVEPSDVIAQTSIEAEPVGIDIASPLALSPAAVAKRLVVNPGQQVEQGAPVARRGSRSARVSKAPFTGIFNSYDPSSGIAYFTVPPELLTVQAHLKGIVTDLVPYYGAVIETPATLVRGIFGVGGEQHGVLKKMATAHDAPLTADTIDAKAAYAIVLGGEVTAGGLRRAIELGARGVIAGGIRASELADFLGYTGAESWRLGAATMESNGWNFPPPNTSGISPVPPDFVLVITEGFGPVSMSPRLFELLAGYDGQEIVLEGTTRLRGGLARPEIIIPLARTTAVRWLEESGPKVEVGKQVRLLSPAYLGQTARITGLPDGPRSAQSGVVTPVADVQLPGGMRLRVPLVNVEVLE